jgi:uncharacterized protein (DUF433 family)
LREELILQLDRITFDSKIMGGRACIRGMRITVALIFNLVANGIAVIEPEFRRLMFAPVGG